MTFIIYNYINHEVVCQEMLLDNFTYKDWYKNIYLLSSHWQAFADYARSVINQCQICGSKSNLQVHHRHYNSLFCETLSDIQLLCKTCHFYLA